MKSKESILPLLPLLLFLLITEVRLGPGQLQKAAPTSVITANLFLYGSIYLLAMGLFVYHKQRQGRVHLWHMSFPLLLMLGYLPVGFLWTVSPVDLLKEIVHFAGVLLIAIVVQFTIQGNNQRFYKTLFLFSLLMALSSLFVSLFIPNFGIGVKGRWQGVTGNPNHLGIISLLGVYSVTVLMARVGLRKCCWWFYLAALFLYFFCLVMADSVSSLVLSIMTVCLIPLVVMTIRSRKVSQAIFQLSLIYVAIMAGIFLVYLVKPESVGLDTFFSSAGRSRTLTGRTELWISGWRLFLERPLLGWGFDNLATLSQQSGGKIGYGQFHNGYIDLLVRGGCAGSIVFLIFCGWLLVAFFRALRKHAESAMCLVLLVFIIYLHNMTESSFLEFPNVFWLLTVTVYFQLWSLARYRNVR
ncbi:MAG: O-antigen ligase family protein [Deltaproteobacteria bacterium]|nr:O-antigen ligase family protein [Deltaproteobacteria bacterium]